MRLYLIELFQFLFCNVCYKCPNWTDLKRLTESVFAVQLKTSLALSHEQIVWENSEIKCMKVPSKNAKQITTVPQSYWYIFSFFVMICCDIFFNLCSFTVSYQWLLYSHLLHHKFVGNLRSSIFSIFLDAWYIKHLFRDSVFLQYYPKSKIL